MLNAETYCRDITVNQKARMKQMSIQSSFTLIPTEIFRNDSLLTVNTKYEITDPTIDFP